VNYNLFLPGTYLFIIHNITRVYEIKPSTIAIVAIVVISVMAVVVVVGASNLVSTALAAQAKVTTCHQNSENGHTQTTGAPSVAAHVRNQGADLGPYLSD
jgi:hypothetical protein